MNPLSTSMMTGFGPKTNCWPMALAGGTAELAEVVYWINGGNHWAVVALALSVAILPGAAQK